MSRKIPDYSELTKVIFVGGQPRNATDYYYHSKSKTFYSNYWANGNDWSINPRMPFEIEYPLEANILLNANNGLIEEKINITKVYQETETDDCRCHLFLRTTKHKKK